MKQNHNFYSNLAFHIAEYNLGKTQNNPSVGCVIVKKNSVISSGVTSTNGRPHAEQNALKKRKNFKNANLYVTLEPCSHHGATPPCTNIIKKKGIKKVFFATIDLDLRSKNKASNILSKKNIHTNYSLQKKRGLTFYQSYFRLKKNQLPIIDAKIAISKDYFTNNKKKKWITNEKSRKLSHLL